jgi:hypothetical protein
VLEAALRPGGVLAAIALPRPDLRHELPVEIVAAAGHRLLGAMFLAKGRWEEMAGSRRMDPLARPCPSSWTRR